MGDYRVDKEKKPVTLHLSGGAVREGVVFLSPFASTHSGRETLLDLLRDEEAFLPFMSDEGAFSLINKRGLAYARHRAQEEAYIVGDMMKVRILFIGGGTLEGTMYLDLPEDKNRLIDYVNATPGFFRVNGEDVQFIVNGSLISEITPLK